MSDFYKMYGSDTEDVGALIEEVAKHKIYFGHQSVGFNILNGIEQWEKETGVQLKKIETRDFSKAGTASFVHFRVGENTDPISKIDDFVTLVENISDETIAVAFFKLCYVDIGSSTDVDALFDYYQEKMLYLKENLPSSKIVLFTVPMTGIQKGIRAIAKKVLGRQPYGILENIKRNEFNQRLLSEIAADFPVFDIAGIETTLPDGSLETYNFKRSEFPCMPEFYSSDIGHLNDYGAKVMAYNLLAFLAAELK